MLTVKDILVESLARSNLVPRKRAVPADMLEDAFRLFKGVVRKYNFSNFINYAQEKIEVNTNSPLVVLTDYDDIESIASVSYRLNADNYTPLRFVSYSQFDTDPDTFIYSWRVNSDNVVELYFKNSFVSSSKPIRVTYNKRLNYDLDTVLYIPDIYEELFTAAVTYKLAITKPRVNDSQKITIKAELDDIENTVRSYVSSQKILTREPFAPSNLAAFKSGSFIFGR